MNIVNDKNNKWLESNDCYNRSQVFVNLEREKWQISGSEESNFSKIKEIFDKMGFKIKPDKHSLGTRLILPPKWKVISETLPEDSFYLFFLNENDHVKVRLHSKKSKDKENVIIACNPRKEFHIKSPINLPTVASHFVPDEVLKTIFKFLPENQYLKLRFVCKNWYKIASMLILQAEMEKYKSLYEKRCQPMTSPKIPLTILMAEFLKIDSSAVSRDGLHKTLWNKKIHFISLVSDLTYCNIDQEVSTQLPKGLEFDDLKWSRILRKIKVNRCHNDISQLGAWAEKIERLLKNLRNDSNKFITPKDRIDWKKKFETVLTILYTLPAEKRRNCFFIDILRLLEESSIDPETKRQRRLYLDMKENPETKRQRKLECSGQKDPKMWQLKRIVEIYKIMESVISDADIRSDIIEKMVYKIYEQSLYKALFLTNFIEDIDRKSNALGFLAQECLKNNVKDAISIAKSIPLHTTRVHAFAIIANKECNSDLKKLIPAMCDLLPEDDKADGLVDMIRCAAQKDLALLSKYAEYIPDQEVKKRVKEMIHFYNKVEIINLDEDLE
jgi:F-box domain